MNNETTIPCRFRSRLNTLPLDLKVDIGEVSMQKGMLASSRKNRVIELLKKYDIPFLESGTGTNRFIIKYDGYAVKIALDKEGIADNRQEWAISSELQPGAAKAHEISKGGHLLVASYRPAFTSHSEMYAYATSIKRILSRWGSRFLLGDVGLTKINYANWGLTPSGEPECIDYAYIFPVATSTFKCICGCENMTFTDNSYSSYKCPECGHRYEDRELRNRISQEERIRLFENIKGIEMTNEFETHDVDVRYLKTDINPDAPNPYDVAMNVSQQMLYSTGRLF
jgi:hypothetical protein